MGTGTVAGGFAVEAAVELGAESLGGWLAFGSAGVTRCGASFELHEVSAASKAAHESRARQRVDMPRG